MAGEHLVQALQLARQVALHLDEAGAALARRQLRLREVHRPFGGADVGIFHQLARHLLADAFLRLLGRAAHVRRQDDVVETLQRRLEGFAVRPRLLREHVHGGPRQVAGFQGLSPEGRITTVGRGGSDTLAVALAVALEATRCDLYSDVTGIFTADPWIVNNARKLDKITCEEMLELASLGAKVLDPRSVRMALRHRLPIQVLSSFADLPGTLIEGTIITDVWGMPLEDDVEHNMVTGIAYSRNDAKITVVRVPDKPGVAADILAPLSEAGINIDMIVQNVSHDGKATDITFTIAREDAERAIDALRKKQDTLEFEKVLSDSNVAKVSVIGVGMQSHAGVAQTMFSALAEQKINIQVISTSEIKISVLIAEEHTECAVRALHAAYRLDEQ